jgi:hypothetical protein
VELACGTIAQRSRHLSVSILVLLSGPLESATDESAITAGSCLSNVSRL